MAHWAQSENRLSCRPDARPRTYSGSRLHPPWATDAWLLAATAWPATSKYHLTRPKSAPTTTATNWTTANLEITSYESSILQTLTTGTFLHRGGNSILSRLGKYGPRELNVFSVSCLPTDWCDNRQARHQSPNLKGLIFMNLLEFTQHGHRRWIRYYCPCTCQLREHTVFNVVKCISKAVLFERSCGQAFRDVILGMSRYPNAISFINAGLPSCPELW